VDMGQLENNIRDTISELFPEAIYWDDLDGCIVGVSTDGRVIYSMYLMIEHFKETMSEEEALEWIDFNILNAHVGEYTPLHIWEIL
jgi:hypothetical protein